MKGRNPGSTRARRARTDVRLGRMNYRPEWTAGASVVLLVLLCAPPFALIAVGVLLIAALATVVALAGAIVAAPYLVFRVVRGLVAVRGET